MINEEIQGQIDTAQNFRRDGRKLLAAGDASGAARKFEQALAAIAAGFQRLEREEPPDPSDPTDEDRDAAKLFADLYGIRGGTYRDMIDLDPRHRQLAISAYDAGARFERDYALASTYNFVNQLVLRFLDRPALLKTPETPLTIEDHDDGPDTDSVRGWLRRADEHVNRSVGRRDDRAWALADLVLLAALQGSGELTSRLASFELQVKRARDTYPYASLLAVVRDLARAIAPDTPPAMVRLERWLDERLTRR